MLTEPRIFILIPESVLDAVEEALHRHLKVMTQITTVHRDRADRVSWAAAEYRLDRFREVWKQARDHRDSSTGFSPETKAELRLHIERHKNNMPRSKANAVKWAEQKVELRREREAYRDAGRKSRRS